LNKTLEIGYFFISRIVGQNLPTARDQSIYVYMNYIRFPEKCSFDARKTEKSSGSLDGNKVLLLKYSTKAYFFASSNKLKHQQKPNKPFELSM
jgi:hypothetical protein